MHDPYSEPTKVTVDDGEVHLDGPDGIAVSMTPEAALETSDRLLQGGVTAHGQKVAKEMDERSRRSPK